MEAPLVGVCDFHWVLCMFVCETSTHVFCVGAEFSHPGWKVQRQHAPRIPSVLRLLRDWATTATMGPQMTAISGAFHGENITRVTKDTIQDSSKIRIDISYQIISGFLDYTTVSLLWSNVEFGRLLYRFIMVNISSKRAAQIKCDRGDAQWAQSRHHGAWGLFPGVSWRTTWEIRLFPLVTSTVCDMENGWTWGNSGLMTTH